MLYTKEDIQKALDKEPELVDRGIGIAWEKNGNREEVTERFKRDREYLLRQISEFNASCKWLSLQKRTKNVNPHSMSSYGLKHIVEGWDKVMNGGGGYVSNGILIAAAIHLGFKYKKYADSPNVYFNISKKLVEIQHGHTA